MKGAVAVGARRTLVEKRCGWPTARVLISGEGQCLQFLRIQSPAGLHLPGRHHLLSGVFQIPPQADRIPGVVVAVQHLTFHHEKTALRGMVFEVPFYLLQSNFLGTSRIGVQKKYLLDDFAEFLVGLQELQIGITDGNDQ